MTHRDALKKYFGYDDFRPGQEEIISEILNNRNVLAILPTGGGKSLCYQIPAIISPGFSIVISPLIALMKDQVDGLKKSGIEAEFINSSLSYSQSENILSNIAYGKIKILYLSPEKLEGISFAEKIKNLKPKFVFIDEAHCISEWGHNFRPGYLKIKEFIKFADVKNISCFTATATPEVREDIINQLDLENPSVFVRGFARDNISLSVIEAVNKKKSVFDLMSKIEKPALIYTSSRKNAEELSDFLNIRRINNRYYHAGLDNIIRKKIQDDFIDEKIDIVIATNAFGMGIDKSNVRTVIHYNIPGSIESFYQEFGRAGRDGNPAAGILFFEKQDIRIQEFLISNSYPKKEVIIDIYSAICDSAGIPAGTLPKKNIPVSPDYISTMLGKSISKGILNSALQILESAGYLRIQSDFERKHYFRFTVSPENLKKYLLSLTDGLKKDVLIFLLRECGAFAFSGKTQIPFEKASSHTGLNNENTLELIKELDNSGLISLETPSSGTSVVLTQHRLASKQLFINSGKINSGYLNAIKKLKLMENYVYHNGCRSDYILKYFGEVNPGYKCRNCDRCKGETFVADENFNFVKESVLKCVSEFEDGIKDTNLLNILTGFTSSLNFQTSSSFGLLKTYTFSVIKSAINTLVSEELIFIDKKRMSKLFLSSTGLQFLKNLGLISQEAENVEENLELYYRLRELRKKVSETFKQPQYLICTDETLRDLAYLKPKTKLEMLKINGFNERTFNKMGEDALEIIAGESIPKINNGINLLHGNIQETLKYLRAGHTFDEICALRNLTAPIISMHIESIIEFYPGIDLANLIDKQILTELESAYKMGAVTMKELKDKTSIKVTFPHIRIFLSMKKSFKN